MRRLRNMLCGGAWLLLAANARGQATYWVHPSLGSDGNPGTVAFPFQTIGRALQFAPAGPLTIRLMPGDYSAATNGESYPLAITHDDVTIAGASLAGGRNRAERS